VGGPPGGRPPRWEAPQVGGPSRRASSATPGARAPTEGRCSSRQAWRMSGSARPGPRPWGAHAGTSARSRCTQVALFAAARFFASAWRALASEGSSRPEAMRRPAPGGRAQQGTCHGVDRQEVDGQDGQEVPRQEVSGEEGRSQEGRVARANRQPVNQRGKLAATSDPKLNRPPCSNTEARQHNIAIQRLSFQRITTPPTASPRSSPTLAGTTASGSTSALPAAATARGWWRRPTTPGPGVVANGRRDHPRAVPGQSRPVLQRGRRPPSPGPTPRSGTWLRRNAFAPCPTDPTTPWWRRLAR